MKKLVSQFYISLFILIFIALFQGTSQAQLNFEKLPELQGASISYMVRDLQSGNLIAEHDTSTVLAPASVLKLFTTAVALDKLGSTKIFKSTFKTNGRVKNGSLYGDLVFDGNFNPTFLAERYNRSMSKMCDDLIVKLKSKGIDTIKGDVRIFDSENQIKSIPRTWIWEDMGNYYGAGSSRTIVNENILKIYLKSGPVDTPVEVLRTEPKLPWLVISSEVFASAVNKDMAYCFSRPGDKKITMTGTIPANRASFLVKASLPDPPGTLAILLKQNLQEKGIVVLGNPVVALRMERLSGLHEVESPTVFSIVRKTNKQSINIYAESLLKIVKINDSLPSISSAECMKQSLGKHFDVKTMRVYDGSGLSRFNAVSAKHVVDLITWMNKHKEKNAFNNSLSVAGESGTLRSMLANTIAKGRVKGKSGSMDGVRAYAGTINTRKGENLAFSVIVNNYNTSNGALKKILEKWLWELWSKN
jgi:D-alanyl-D-alanine carboxypeptidase/D-alanyl-D-alanine-endopeptidase (penicillin-binding protein 4)